MLIKLFSEIIFLSIFGVLIMLENFFVCFLVYCCCKLCIFINGFVVFLVLLDVFFGVVLIFVNVID